MCSQLDGSVHGARVIREDEGAVNNTDRIKVVER